MGKSHGPVPARRPDYVDQASEGAMRDPAGNWSGGSPAPPMGRDEYSIRAMKFKTVPFGHDHWMHAGSRLAAAQQ